MIDRQIDTPHVTGVNAVNRVNRLSFSISVLPETHSQSADVANSMAALGWSLCRSSHLHHGPGSGRRQRAAGLFKMVNNFLDHLLEFAIDFHRVDAVDAGDKVWTFADVNAVLVA